MATSCRSKINSQRFGILVGYNLPFILWTGFALLTTALGASSLWSCPVRGILGWCPGCGLTRAYGTLLFTGRLTSLWLGCILTVFVSNAIWSVIKASRCVASETAPPQAAQAV